MNELCIALSAAEATSGLAEGLAYTVSGFLKNAQAIYLVVSCTVTVLILSFYSFSL